MNFPSCCGPSTVVENWALGNKFYYCTECREEVSDKLPPTEMEIATAAPVYDNITFSGAVYPTVPTPLSIEALEDPEPSLPWVDGFDFPPINDKDDQDNG